MGVMPRRARIYIPDFPYHIVQRGNNREACFIEPENYLFFSNSGVSVHSVMALLSMLIA